MVEFSALRPDGSVAAAPPARPDADVLVAAGETTRMPMVLADARLPECTIVFANEAFLDLTGYAYDEVIGRNCRFLQGSQTDRQTISEIADALARREK